MLRVTLPLQAWLSHGELSGAIFPLAQAAEDSHGGFGRLSNGHIAIAQKRPILLTCERGPLEDRGWEAKHTPNCTTYAAQGHHTCTSRSHSARLLRDKLSTPKDDVGIAQLYKDLHALPC